MSLKLKVTTCAPDEAQMPVLTLTKRAKLSGRQKKKYTYIFFNVATLGGGDCGAMLKTWLCDHSEPRRSHRSYPQSRDVTVPNIPHSQMAGH